HQKVRTATDKHDRQTVHRTEFQNVGQPAARFRFNPKLRRTTGAEGGVLGKGLVQPHFARAHYLSELRGYLEILHQFGGFFVDISCSKTEDQISRLRDSSDLAVEKASFRHVHGGGRVVRVDGGHNRVTRNPGDRRFARGVNIRHVDRIRQIEGRSKFLLERLGP